MLQRTRKYPDKQDYPFQTFQKLFHKFSTSDTVKKNHHDLFQKIVQDANPKKQIQSFFKAINSTKPKPKLLLRLSDPIDLKIVALANEIIMTVNQDAWREAELVDMASCDIDAPVIINMSNQS